MPSIEPEKSEMENCTQNDNGYVSGQTVRELTQTDRLNKRLLETFLQRVNENGFQVHIDTNDKEDDKDD